jgi:molybdopterin synthase sulfur carrier subunit
MPRVFIPTPLRSLSNGREIVVVGGTTVRSVLAALDQECPGVSEFLVDVERDRIRAGIQIAIDGTVAALGLLEPVSEDAEVHIIPAIGGGAPLVVADHPGESREEGFV